MGEVKISGLPSDSSLDNNHYVPINDPTGPTTKRTLLSTLAAFFFEQTNIPSGNGSPVTRADEMTSDYILSGGVWSGDAYASTRNASMTAAVVYINGRRISISAVSARSFTASKDTYIDILDNGDGTGTLVYTEVTNNAASPSLAANSIRIGIVVTGASNIAASTSISQGGFANTLPTISSQILKGNDTLGNVIYPKGPASTRLMQIPYKFSAYRSSNQSISSNTVTKINFDVKRYDTNNNFDTSTATWTVPISGYYYVNASVQTLLGTTNTDINLSLYRNGSQFRKGGNIKNGVFCQPTVSGIFQLVAGDTLDARFLNILNSDTIEGVSTSNTFEAFLVSAS